MDESKSDGMNYFGLSRFGWYALSPEERVIHYNRQAVCEHQADFQSWPELLREAWSFDPYAHTAHMISHRPNDTTCECQGCDLKIGILREEHPTPQGAENDVRFLA